MSWDAKKMDDERVIPPDEQLRKRLFATPSPNKTASEDEGDDIEAVERPSNGKGPRPEKRRREKKAGFGLSLLAVMLFLVLCALALAVTLHPNASWREITWEKAQEGALQFFSNEPLDEEGRTTQVLFGLLGALPLAVSIGVVTGAFTCLFMYYDSDVPGDFPPTPVSPRKAADPSPSASRWHLGYIFVPVNAIVAFSLALFYLRLHLGLAIL